MQHTNAVRKPVGGFVFISVMQLCRVWVAYQQRRIRLVDVWVWWAAHEVVAKRCQITPGQKRRYCVEELDRLVGSAHSMPQSLRRLAQAGLLCWDEEQITFPEEATSMDERQALNAMLEQIPNHRRRVPVPRRLIRYLAGGCRRVRMATLLGHLLRCLYYRAGQCCPDGHCKATWIAKVFGVGLRQVKRERQQLEDLGLVQRHAAPQWVLNRYGVDLTVNLQWDGPPHDDEPQGTPFLSCAAASAVPSSVMDRSDSVASPAAFTVADAHTSTQAVRETTADHQDTHTDSAPPVVVLPLACVPAEVDGARSTNEQPQHPASSDRPRSLVAMVEQARADLRAGRVSRTDDDSVALQSLCVSHPQRSRVPASPATLAPPTGTTGETGSTAPLSLLVQEGQKTDPRRLYEAHEVPRMETQTNARPHDFQPIQTVLTTLQLPASASPRTDRQRSALLSCGEAVATPCTVPAHAACSDTPVLLETPAEMTPLTSPKHPELTPPDSDRELSLREEKDQKPATHGSAGILSAMVLEIQAEMKAGVSARSEHTAVLTPRVSPPLCETWACRGEREAPTAPVQQTAVAPVAAVPKPKEKLTPQTPPAALLSPTLRHILVQDLRKTERLLQLYDQAVTAGLLSRSEADRLNFVALAHHVLSYRPENPGGLFTQLLRQRHFDYITQDDEDAAQQRLKRVLYGGAGPVLHDASATEQRRAG